MAVTSKVYVCIPGLNTQAPQHCKHVGVDLQTDVESFQALQTPSGSLLELVDDSTCLRLDEANLLDLNYMAQPVHTLHSPRI